MGLSGGMQCLKYLLFAFNFVFWICGIAIFGVGIYSRVKSKDWDSLLGNDGTIVSAANIMIAAGALVMLIGFLGCCGAWKESKFMLIAYAILLMLIFILEIAAGIYAYTKKDTVLKKLKENIKKSVSVSYGDNKLSDKALTDATDEFQKLVKCCGSDKPIDWASSSWYKAKSTGNGTKELVPMSCCVTRKTGCNKGPDGGIPALVTSKAIFSKGCVDAGEKYVKDHLLEIGGAAIGIAFLQIIGIVFAILLCRSLNGHEKI